MNQKVHLVHQKALTKKCPLRKVQQHVQQQQKNLTAQQLKKVVLPLLKKAASKTKQTGSPSGAGFILLNSTHHFQLFWVLSCLLKTTKILLRL